MPTVTFQVLEGIDKGRTFRDLATPVTIGREEGNVVRLNDERVSRFHAKIQSDGGEIIITDLESTNGTRVNGNVVQIRRLRPGDRVGVGRSLMLFGSEDEIAARVASINGSVRRLPPTVQGAESLAMQLDREDNFDLDPKASLTTSNGTVYMGTRALPPLPQRLSPAQAARLAEMLDFLHRHLTLATENIKANEEGTEVVLSFTDWQRVLTVQMLLARYVRAIAEPEALAD